MEEKVKRMEDEALRNKSIRKHSQSAQFWNKCCTPRRSMVLIFILGTLGLLGCNEKERQNYTTLNRTKSTHWEARIGNHPPMHLDVIVFQPSDETLRIFEDRYEFMRSDILRNKKLIEEGINKQLRTSAADQIDIDAEIRRLAADQIDMYEKKLYFYTDKSESGELFMLEQNRGSQHTKGMLVCRSVRVPIEVVITYNCKAPNDSILPKDIVPVCKEVYELFINDWQSGEISTEREENISLHPGEGKKRHPKIQEIFVDDVFIGPPDGTTAG